MVRVPLATSTLSKSSLIGCVAAVPFGGIGQRAAVDEIIVLSAGGSALGVLTLRRRAEQVRLWEAVLPPEVLRSAAASCS